MTLYLLIWPIGFTFKVFVGFLTRSDLAALLDAGVSGWITGVALWQAWPEYDTSCFHLLVELYLNGIAFAKFATSANH